VVAWVSRDDGVTVPPPARESWEKRMLVGLTGRLRGTGPLLALATAVCWRKPDDPLRQLGVGTVVAGLTGDAGRERRPGSSTSPVVKQSQQIAEDLIANPPRAADSMVSSVWRGDLNDRFPEIVKIRRRIPHARAVWPGQGICLPVTVIKLTSDRSGQWLAEARHHGRSAKPPCRACVQEISGSLRKNRKSCGDSSSLSAPAPRLHASFDSRACHHSAE
jgi:hypothetical protein